MRRSILLLPLAILASISLAVPPEDAPPKLSDLLTGSGLQINLSGKDDLRLHKWFGGYNLSYKDHSLFSGGTMSTAPDFKLGDDPIKFGDAPLSVSFQNGAGQVGGTLFSTIGVAPLNIGSVLPKSVRLLFGMDGSVLGQASTTGVDRYGGIEWLPFGTFTATSEHFLGLSARYEDSTDAANVETKTGTLAAGGRFG